MAVLGTIGGDPRRALANADQAIAISVENEFASPNYRASFLRGSLLAHAGDCQLGIELMQRAVAAAERNSERNRRTLYLCQIASAHVSLGRPEVGLGLVEEAVQIAETTSEQARWWELRVATDLAKHWHDEGRYVEANSLLQPIYNWFVEGFDTPDLKDAKTLLDELENSAAT